MAEIQNLRDIFRKEGLQFVHNLFSDFVVISEKINATRFAFEKREDGTFPEGTRPDRKNGNACQDPGDSGRHRPHLQ